MRLFLSGIYNKMYVTGLGEQYEEDGDSDEDLSFSNIDENRDKAKLYSKEMIGGIFSALVLFLTILLFDVSSTSFFVDKRKTIFVLSILNAILCIVSIVFLSDFVNTAVSKNLIENCYLKEGYTTVHIGSGLGLICASSVYVGILLVSERMLNRKLYID